MFRPLLYSRSKARAIRTQTRLSVRQFRVPARLTEADRKLGTVVAIEGEGADQWITIEEEKSKDFFYWVVWPFNYHGIRESPLKVGDKLSFLHDTTDRNPFKAKGLRLQATGRAPGFEMGQELNH